MALKGFVKIDRKITEWGWYKDANTFRVFFHLLMTANFKKSMLEGHEVNAGEAVYSREGLAKILKISVAQVRTAIKHLKTTNEITTRSASKFTIATITNWAFYQSGEERVSSEMTSDVAAESPAIDRRLTGESPHLKNGRREEGKNEKKVLDTREESAPDEREATNADNIVFLEQDLPPEMRDESYQEAIEAYKMAFNATPNRFVSEEVKHWAEETERGIIPYAFRQASADASSGTFSWKYVVSILRHWEQQGLKTIEQVQEHEAKREREKMAKRERAPDVSSEFWTEDKYI